MPASATRPATTLPEVTEAHRLAAFKGMGWAGWSYRQAMADPIRSRVIEARAHQLRTQQWQTQQRAQRRTAHWFDAKAAAAGLDA